MDLYSHPTGAVSDADTTLYVPDTVSSSFLSSLPGVAPDALSFIGNLRSTFDLTTSAAIVQPGSNVNLHAHTDASLYVADNSVVDLSSSQKDDSTPVALNISVGGGNNSVTLNTGPTAIFSTDGNDTMKSSGGLDSMYGGSGHDSMVGGGQSLMVGGSSGGDTMTSSGGFDSMYGGLGYDSMVGSGQTLMVGGTEGGDTMIGGLAAGAQDTISSSGSSLIHVSLGQNQILAGAGDTVRAGSSQSSIFAADGTTTVRGGDGATVYGTGQSDIVGGGNGNTINLFGNDTLQGGPGSNTVFMQTQGRADVQGGVDVQGGQGHLNVNIDGASGSDTLFGGSGGLTIHVNNAMGAIVNDTNTLDAAGAHVVQFASGLVLHVSNVTFDFGNDQQKYV